MNIKTIVIARRANYVTAGKAADVFLEGCFAKAQRRER